MIDGDDAEVQASKRVFPGIPIRLCQFHLVQAVRSTIRRLFGRFPNPDECSLAVVEAVRDAQRCPKRELWPQYHRRLRQAVLDVADGDQNLTTQVMAYFKRSWFSDRWLEHTVDFGLPPYITRDGPWSTNNFSEANFRVFDLVFLNCRANRRWVSLSDQNIACAGF